MRFKGLFADKGGAFQLVILLLLMLLGLLLSTLLTSVFVLARHGLTTNILADPDTLRFVQLFSVIGTFLFPALAGAWLFSTQPKFYLSLRPVVDIKIYLWVLLFMILLSPIINLSALINKEFVLPPFLEGLENWMLAKEAEAEKMTELLLSGTGVITLLMNLLVVAVAAGITEEFLFRGTLQRILGKWSANHHLVIWVVAFIFSAIHLQFYGLIPRMLLGGFFGYLLYWTKSIWIPVFAHFLNNAFGVIAMSREDWKNNEFINGEIPPEKLWMYAVWAVISLVILYFCINKFKREQQKNIHTPKDILIR